MSEKDFKEIKCAGEGCQAVMMEPKDSTRTLCSTCDKSDGVVSADDGESASSRKSVEDVVAAAEPEIAAMKKEREEATKEEPAPAVPLQTFEPITGGFFTQLMALGSVDVTLTIKEKNGQFTMSVLPKAANQAAIQPILITGTPKELDAEFFSRIGPTLQRSMIAIQNMDAHKKSVDAVTKKEEPKPAAPSKPAPAKAATASKKGASKKAEKAAPAKTEKPKPEPVAEEKPKFEEPKLF